MFSKIYSVHYLGLQTYKVDVEADVVAGVPVFNIVGLPDTAIKESRERVRSAIQNSEFEFPMRKITVNLAPADLKKEGPSFDLAIAVAVLKATRQIKEAINDYCFCGELSLTGEVRSVSGALLLAEAAKNAKKKYIFLPEKNAEEASLVEGINVVPINSLRQAVSYLADKDTMNIFKHSLPEKITNKYLIDFSDVKGQLFAKRALEISAAGFHNIVMVGSPGSGKSMLAKRLPTIMPDLTKLQSIETTKIHSVARVKNFSSVITNRPFRSPHHTISAAALIGGGSNPRPGEISLSHLGVLFLDEFTEFNKNVLEALRQPLEDGKVSISRVLRQHTYPSRFCLVAAMNPCRCGYYGDKIKHCICTPGEINRYRNKLSGPLIERIDLHVDVLRLSKNELINENKCENSEEIKKRVEEAHVIQNSRFSKSTIDVNSQMNSCHISKYCKLTPESTSFISVAIEKLGLSARSYDKILKISRTIADLANEADIKTEHISEAIQYRQLDKRSLGY